MLEDMERIRFENWGVNEEKEFLNRLRELTLIALRHAYSDIVEIDVERVNDRKYYLYFCQEDGRCSRSIIVEIGVPINLEKKLYVLANKVLKDVKQSLEKKYGYPSISVDTSTSLSYF